MLPDTKTVWSDSIDAEVNYWYRKIKEDRKSFQQRYRRARPSNQMLPGFVNLFPTDKVSLLDVGSGPAPVVIGDYAKHVEITACDPLADHYQQLLDRYGISSPVQVVRADGEQLAKQFGEGRFDITHIQNALDHSYQPVEIVRNMLRCTKPGGLVLIRTIINEGANEHYHGLHQWDLSPGAGDFYIRHRDGDTTAMRALLADDVEFFLLGTHSSFHNSNLQNWMDVVLVKKGATEEFCAQVEAEFFTVQVELGRAATDEQRRHYERKITRLRAQITGLTSQKATLEQSAAYQLGMLLLRARRSPSKLVALPRDLVRLRQSRRRERTRATA